MDNFIPYTFSGRPLSIHSQMFSAHFDTVGWAAGMASSL